jgi:hypothetical protein
MSPLRRFETPAASCVPVAGAQQPLVKLAALQSVVCADVSGLLGYPDPAHASSFPTDRGGLPPSPSPCLLRHRVHPLVSFVLLQSSSWQSSARALARSCSSRGVSSLFATSTRGVHLRRASRARLRSARSVSHALDGLLLPVPCADFHCAAVSRVLASGVCSSDLAVPPRGGRSPLVVGAVRLPVARLQRASRRPQGLDPDRSPRCDPRPLLRFQLPRACLQRPWQCRRTPSARGLVLRYTRAPQVDPQRLDQSPAFTSVPRGSSRPSFPALRPIVFERLSATADAHPYEHAVCHAQLRGSSCATMSSPTTAVWIS